MGSSSKKKKDKQKDFQKPKLKVGKTKAKADNFTDTSFKAKSIVVNQQSLTTGAPSSASQWTHYLSLASSSRTDTQRRDALAYLTTQLSSKPVNDPLPLPTAVLLPKLIPLISDGTGSVRKQLVKFFQLLPAAEVESHTEKILLYTRVGMTHLALEIRMDALSVLEWILEAAEGETLSCPGGWVKTLKSFMAMLGWYRSKGSTGWSSVSSTLLNKQVKEYARQMLVLSKFLKSGLREVIPKMPPPSRQAYFPLTDVHLHQIPTRSNAYRHLNLFGAPRDEDSEIYPEQEDRQRIFRKLFQKDVEEGIKLAKRDAGIAGRAAATLEKVLEDGMSDYNGFDDTQ